MTWRPLTCCATQDGRLIYRHGPKRSRVPSAAQRLRLELSRAADALVRREVQQREFALPPCLVEECTHAMAQDSDNDCAACEAPPALVQPAHAAASLPPRSGELAMSCARTRPAWSVRGQQQAEERLAREVAACSEAGTVWARAPRAFAAGRSRIRHAGAGCAGATAADAGTRSGSRWGLRVARIRAAALALGATRR